MTNDMKKLVPFEEYPKLCATVIQHYENLTSQESIMDIKDQFPVLLNQLEDGIKDFNVEILHTSFSKIFKEKCKSSWDSLFKEYCGIMRCRYQNFFASCKSNYNYTIIKKYSTFHVILCLD